MDSDQLRDVVANLNLSRRPSIIIIPLPGQMPGQYMPEHDNRILRTLQTWRACYYVGCDVQILCSSGTADSTGLTVAEYMKRQLLHYGGLDATYIKALEKDIIIGERTSAHTAGQFLGLKDYLRQRHAEDTLDLVILVSNWWHLAIARVYFARLVGLPYVIDASSGRGALGLPWPLYLARQVVHLLVALIFDRSGHLLDRISASRIEGSAKHTLPSIPPQP